METLIKKNKLYVVMYHYTRDLLHNRYPNIKGLDVSLFKEQINYLTHHFHIVTMEEVILASKNRYELPENALLLTFDDGYIDNYTYVFPILKENNVQGSFFIPGKTFAEHCLLDVNKIHYILASSSSQQLLKDVFERMNYYRGSEYDFPNNDELWEKYGKIYENSNRRFDTTEVCFVKNILQTVLPEKVRNRISSDLFKKYVGISEETLAYELYLTEEQITLMKRNGMYVGIHGYDHYWLGKLPKNQMRADIDKALLVMDKFIDKDNWVMNYPYGNCNNEVIEYIKEKGCCLAFTTEVRIADLNKDHLFRLPRLDCNDFPPKSENYLHM